MDYLLDIASCNGNKHTYEGKHMRTTKIVSPSRTYVAICNKPNFDGHYFRKFHLPTHILVGFELENGHYTEGSLSRIIPNTSEDATWYFLNVLNMIACIDGVITWEDFNSLEDQDEINAKTRKEYAKVAEVCK